MKQEKKSGKSGIWNLTAITMNEALTWASWRKLNNGEGDKEEEEAMPGTARDLGLRFEGQRSEPKVCW